MENPDAVKHETVMDTGAEKLGKTYARALLSAAEKTGISGEVVGQLNELVDGYLSASPALATALASPQVDVEEKHRVIDRIFGEEFQPLLVTFLKVMADRGRLGYVRAVRDGAVEQYDQMIGQVMARVSTAVPLDDALRSQITERLGGLLGRKVRLQEVVDSDLIGGMVIRVGDTVYDNSVVGRIDSIGKQARAGFSSKLLQNFQQLTRE